MEQTIVKERLVKGQKIQEYYKDYYLENKDIILGQGESWREENAGQFVYMFISDDKFLYGGSYYNRPLIERVSFHANGKSNLHTDMKQLHDEYGMNMLLYKDFNEYKLNKNDLRFIERYYLQTYKPLLNKNRVLCNENELSRSKEELRFLAESVPFFEFSIDRYLD